jgi:hypothetical protein
VTTAPIERACGHHQRPRRDNVTTEHSTGKRRDETTYYSVLANYRHDLSILAQLGKYPLRKCLKRLKKAAGAMPRRIRNSKVILESGSPPYEQKENKKKGLFVDTVFFRITRRDASKISALTLSLSLYFQCFGFFS